MNKKKLIIIDGYSFFFRCYYATANNITYTKSGIPTNAILAFANMINKILNNLKNEELIFVGLDSGKPSFRKQQYEGYKANRPPCPEDLKVQMPIVREFLDAMSIKYFEFDGFEGDDICGSVAKLASKNNYDVVIYTSDYDFLQLIDNNIAIRIIKKGLKDTQYFDNQNIVIEYGLKPEQITDFKGLNGDTSDNILGIPTIGPKTAKKLLLKYNNYENIISNVDEIAGIIGKNIKNNQQQGRKAKELATIKTDIKIPFLIDELEYSGCEYNKIENFCQKYELKTILKNIKKIKNINDNLLSKTNNLAFDNYKKIFIFLDIFNKTKIKSIIISVNDDENFFYFNNEKINKNSLLKEIFNNKQIDKYVNNFKKDKFLLKKIGIDFLGLKFDLFLAKKILNDYSIIFNTEIINNEQINKNYIIFEQAIDLLKKNELYDFFDKIEIPFYEIIINAKLNGQNFKQKLDNILFFFNQKKKNIIKEINIITGETFNYLNKEEIKQILIKKLKLKEKEKVKIDEILNNLKHKNIIVDKILIFFKYENIIFFLEKLQKYFFEENYELQNINFENNEKYELINFFKNEDYQIISFKYLNIELYILLFLINSSVLLDFFLNDNDDSYKKIFNLNRNLTKNEKKQKKNIIFNAVIFGINEDQLSKKMNVNCFFIRKIIKNFYNYFPEIKKKFTEIILDAYKKKYIKTCFNHKIYISNKRNILNVFFQETKKEILKIIIIKINNLFVKEKYHSNFLIKIKNELFFKINKNELEIIEKITEIMENIEKFPKLKVIKSKIN